MSKYYPVRRYNGPAEIRRGDVVRMRHDGELHGGVSPAFDDYIVASVTDESATLARPFASLQDGEVVQRCETFDTTPARIVEHFFALTRGPTGEVDNRICEQQWSVRFTHQIAPRDTDTAPDVSLPLRAFDNNRTLAAALRDVGILPAGGSVREYRYEGTGEGRETCTYLVFPHVPGMTTFWHCIVLTFVREPRRLPAEYA
jgi:hypothetical protein